VAAESPSASAAIDATKGQVVLYKDRVADTLYFSTSGGRTASSLESTGTAVPYLVPVADPYDTLSPYHDWVVTLSDADAAQRLRTVLQGDLVDIAVVATTPSGRAATVRVTGTLGVADIPAATARSLLGLPTRSRNPSDARHASIASALSHGPNVRNRLG
jgi:stage II sporulation protein D